ncbi:hypothetical protein GCM10012288_20230 [Malaciobacter pacificus]|uniref:DUF3095 domain-containing protein n=1 Tax=Malaciobacter pacificus TaxID=1080223 RepID=A0A5C2H9W6_9BACT|nr:DUF3095 domain-containing protein [Malaciobacter pacificus]QEP34285.1 DUF3095 domain-containing protein [Malaciobacter pacificus]GGD45896.1 hypothetical protein GCM10012288_20230 [Malaciobacter pacificus]
MKQTIDFYKDLKTFTNFSDITEDKYFKEIPDDWFVVVSDIKNSTKAIETGMYKQVNFVASLLIIGILNINRKLDLPFCFGGDGASVLIPNSIVNEAKKVLVDTKSKAKTNFDLNLRIGIISVKEIKELGAKIEISKLSLSKEHSQAIIRGNGLELAEELIKKDEEKYSVKDFTHIDYESDFEGLECRWQDIPSPKDETLSILIKSLKDEDSSKKIYKNILLKIEEITGSYDLRHPILDDSKLNLSFNPMVLNAEASLFSKSKIGKLFNFFKIYIENILGKYLMSKGNWGDYKNRILRTTDTEKFDDMIRMVISINNKDLKTLESFLEDEYKKRNIIYGIHKSNSALMTCLIFERHGKHIHFIDSSNGGYAIAAKQMKNQIKDL